MIKRYYKTIKVRGYRAKEGEGIDEMIQDVLEDITRQNGSVRLFDFKFYDIETQPLPPRYETYLTVVAESEE